MRGIDFEALSHHFGRDISDLKQESYAFLEQMEDRMWKEKAEQEAKRRGSDDEYIRLLKKYFTMWNLLTRYWTEGEVVAASARHMGVRDLTEEHRVKKTANGSAYRGADAEYLRTSMESIPRYSKVEHAQLMEGERCMCDVYRVKNSYQHTRHGNVVLDLLYGTFPELREFQFDAYGLDYQSEKDYEIYPANHIYTPLEAMLTGDIEAIKTRNNRYAAAYNHGAYTVSAVNERLNSKEAEHYFDVIRNLDRTKLANLQKVPFRTKPAN